jgi:hypothetical protein
VSTKSDQAQITKPTVFICRLLEHRSLDLAYDFPCDGRHAGFQT